MAKLTWDETGERFYETGVEKGVLYPYDSTNGYDTGVAWNGLTSVSESPSGADPTDLWADDIKYATLRSSEKFAATIEAYTYPDEWAVCDGSAETAASGVFVGQQPRKTFGLCYRTQIRSYTDSDAGYKLHLVYGCTASPSQKAYTTINDNPNAITFSWSVEASPVPVTGFKPTATIVIDSREFTSTAATKLAALEDVLYGIDAEAFDASKTYAVGDVVTYQNKTYKCKTAISTAAAWDSTKWDEIENNGPMLPMPDDVIDMLD